MSRYVNEIPSTVIQHAAIPKPPWTSFFTADHTTPKMKIIIKFKEIKKSILRLFRPSLRWIPHPCTGPSSRADSFPRIFFGNCFSIHFCFSATHSGLCKKCINVFDPIGGDLSGGIGSYRYSAAGVGQTLSAGGRQWHICSLQCLSWRRTSAKLPNIRWNFHGQLNWAIDHRHWTAEQI